MYSISGLPLLVSGGPVTLVIDAGLYRRTEPLPTLARVLPGPLLGRALCGDFLTRVLLPDPRRLAHCPILRNDLAAAPAAVYRRALPGLAVPGPAVAACPGYRRRTVAGVLTLSAAIFRMTRPCGPTGLR